MRRRIFATFAAVLCQCGGASTQAVLGPRGGEVCSAGNGICLVLESGSVDREVTLRVSPAQDLPPAALGDGFDISVVGASSFTFLKGAHISMKAGDLAESAGFNPNLLRIYTREGGEWVPLDEGAVDRVKGIVTGRVWHLSPFVILRADRLPDGGLPIEGDGGRIVPPINPPPPPFDAGTRDAGPTDAGRPDAGPMDAGRLDSGVVDGGTVDGGVDAGSFDAGPVDAGHDAGSQADSGLSDAGVPDSGVVDAGLGDAGKPDAGTSDAGSTDSGTGDAGPVDAGASDAGDAG